jgi:hypothetical protein
MEKLEVEDLIWDLVGIPDREDKKGILNQFWRDIESPNLKTAMIFCILNEIRGASSDKNLSSRECRTIVSRLQGYVTLLDLSDTLLAQKERISNMENEDSPAEVEFPE